jgi:hypothetical protein
MKMNDVYPSTWMSADDIDGELTVTIRDYDPAEQREFKTPGKATPDSKPVLYFKSPTGTKPLILNKTNWKTIGQVLGSDDSEDWVGQANYAVYNAGRIVRRNDDGHPRQTAEAEDGESGGEYGEGRAAESGAGRPVRRRNVRRQPGSRVLGCRRMSKTDVGCLWPEYSGHRRIKARREGS